MLGCAGSLLALPSASTMPSLHTHNIHPCRALAVWACNLGLLLAARLGNGFRFADLASALAPLDAHRCG